MRARESRTMGKTTNYTPPLEGAYPLEALSPIDKKSQTQWERSHCGGDEEMRKQWGKKNPLGHGHV